MLLPEIWIKIILYMDYNTIKSICKANKYIKNVCNTNKKLIIDKFGENSFDTSKFENIEFYEKVNTINNRMKITSFDKDILSIVYNNHLFTIKNFYNNTFEVNEDRLTNNSFEVSEDRLTNKLFRFGNKKVTLDNNGVVKIDDKTLTIDSVVINTYVDGYNVVIITISKELYIWNGNLYRIYTPFKVKQCKNDIYLTEEGEAYTTKISLFQKVEDFECLKGSKKLMISDGIYIEEVHMNFYKIHNVSNAHKVIHENMIMGENGSVYNKQGELHQRYINIIQLEEHFFYFVLLDDQNNVYYQDNTSRKKINIPANNNIMEILIHKHLIFMLDYDMKLYICDNKSLKVRWSFDFLDFLYLDNISFKNY